MIFDKRNASSMWNSFNYEFLTIFWVQKSFFGILSKDLPLGPVGGFNRNASAGSLRCRASIRGNLFAYVNLNKIWQPVFKSIYEENFSYLKTAVISLNLFQDSDRFWERKFGEYIIRFCLNMFQKHLWIRSWCFNFNSIKALLFLWISLKRRFRFLFFPWNMVLHITDLQSNN